MPDLPRRKVGIVACSGEELPEGTVTRLGALKVLEELRPGQTVTICLPLFLAGGAGDRAFARFYPTIAIDGCERRCAARATEMHSGKPAASIVVTDVVAEEGLSRPTGARRLDAAGQEAVAATAARVASRVDELLGQSWDRRTGATATDGHVASGTDAERPEPTGGGESVEATCACGSGIPVQTVDIAGQPVALVGLPLIFEQFYDAERHPSEAVARELLDTVKIYNPVGADDAPATATALLRAYEVFRAERDARASASPVARMSRGDQ
jgi:hypothetical protein